MSEMHGRPCPNCGAAMLSHGAYCARCGYGHPEEATQQEGTEIQPGLYLGVSNRRGRALSGPKDGAYGFDLPTGPSDMSRLVSHSPNPMCSTVGLHTLGECQFLPPYDANGVTHQPPPAPHFVPRWVAHDPVKECEYTNWHRSVACGCLQLAKESSKHGS